MGLCLGKTTAPPCWLDLPPEVAGEILCRLPTQEDRINFRTVCREWHLAARHHGSVLPPVVPCINLGNGMYQSIVTDHNSSKVYRRRFPGPTDFRARATFGGWVLYKHESSRQLFLYKPSSSSTPAIKLACSYEQTMNRETGNYNPLAALILDHWLFLLKKIVVCSSRLVAAMNGRALLIDAPVGSYCFSPKTTNILYALHFSYKDIAFHRGKIFALSSTEHLFSHCLAGEASSQGLTDQMEGLFWHWSSGETPYQIRTEHVIKEQPSAVAAAANNYHHLVTSADNQKLLMVRWSVPQPSNCIEDDNQVMSLQVFEAELDKGMWMEVKDLGNQVLFVGPTGSRAFLAEGSSKHYYSPTFQGGNRVFILGHDWESARRLAAATPSRYLERQKLVNDVPNYFVYDMATGKSSLVGHRSTKSPKAEWFFSSV
ncbi:unnamed protein product [Alopecurus aequalis]